MLIRKTQQPSKFPSNSIHDTYTESTSGTYNCDYINELTNYVLEEQVVGKWIDGKPIYRKVYTGDLGTSGITSLDSREIFDKIINKGGWVSQDANNKMDVGGYLNSNWYNGLNIDVSKNLILFHATNLKYKYEVWVEYTKTTD